MKKLLTLVLALLMILSFAACKDATDDTTDSSDESTNAPEESGDDTTNTDPAGDDTTDNTDVTDAPDDDTTGGTGSVTEPTGIEFIEKNDTVYIINCFTLALRQEPSLEATALFYPTSGTELKRTGIATAADIEGITWSRVEYGGKVCYASTKFLSTEKLSDPSVAALYNNGDISFEYPKGWVFTDGMVQIIQNPLNGDNITVAFESITDFYKGFNESKFNSVLKPTLEASGITIDDLKVSTQKVNGADVEIATYNASALGANMKQYLYIVSAGYTCYSITYTSVSGSAQEAQALLESIKVLIPAVSADGLYNESTTDGKFKNGYLSFEFASNWAAQTNPSSFFALNPQTGDNVVVAYGQKTNEFETITAEEFAAELAAEGQIITNTKIESTTKNGKKVTVISYDISSDGIAIHQTMLVVNIGEFTFIITDTAVSDNGVAEKILNTLQILK